MNITRARKLTAEIRSGVERISDALIEAHHGRIWEPLGYPTWDAYCDAELGVRLALPREARQDVVVEMTVAGMSSRAIGSAIGVGYDTVQRDRRETGDRNRSPAEVVVGLDGKRYPQPPTRQPAARHTRPGVNPWSLRVQTISAKCPLRELDDDELAELRGAAEYLFDYCTGEQIRRATT